MQNNLKLILCSLSVLPEHWLLPQSGSCSGCLSMHRSVRVTECIWLITREFISVGAHISVTWNVAEEQGEQDKCPSC